MTWKALIKKNPGATTSRKYFWEGIQMNKACLLHRCVEGKMTWGRFERLYERNHDRTRSLTRYVLFVFFARVSLCATGIVIACRGAEGMYGPIRALPSLPHVSGISIFKYHALSSMRSRLCANRFKLPLLYGRLKLFPSWMEFKTSPVIRAARSFVDLHGNFQWSSWKLECSSKSLVLPSFFFFRKLAKKIELQS